VACLPVHAIRAHAIGSLKRILCDAGSLKNHYSIRINRYNHYTAPVQRRQAPNNPGLSPVSRQRKRGYGPHSENRVGCDTARWRQMHWPCSEFGSLMEEGGIVQALDVKMVVDGTGAEPIGNQAVIIDAGQFVGIVPSAELHRTYPGIEVLDFGGSWLLPGFIDLHVHLRNPHDNDVPRLDQFRHRVGTPSALAVLHGVRAAQRCLVAGFTTVRNMGGVEFTALDRAFEDGLLPGPRVLTSGMVLKTGGHTDRALPTTLPRHGTWSAWQTSDGVDEIRKRVRELIRAGASFIKMEASGGLYQSDVPGHSADELRSGIDEAHGLGVRVAVHAHSRTSILAAAKAGADTIEHGTFVDDECIEAMLRHGTAFVPTMSIMNDSITRCIEWGCTEEMLEKERQLLGVRMEAVRKAHIAGVRVGLGTDSAGWLGRHGANGAEFALLVEAGLHPLASIAAGTGIASAILGMEDSIGTVTAGKGADFVTVTVDPVADVASLADPSNIETVWKDGKLIVDRRESGESSLLIWDPSG